MTAQDIIKHWKETAQDDLETARILVDSKKYSQCLFFCHLSIEKLLKSLVIAKTNDLPHPIHDLKKLASQAKLSVSSDQETQLEEMTTWNINARYDDYKRKFYKKATKEFTLHWFTIVGEMTLWLKKQY